MRGMEIVNFPKQGYEPLTDYGEWRVAVLTFCEDVRVESIRSMQKHDQTDEVFVLVSGRGTLFLAGNGERPGKIEALVLEKGKVYNVKKGFWHNHILDERGTVLIVENRNTCDENSPICLLTKEDIERFRAEYRGY
ncbi:MAG: cupin domain-containing protein [Agathobacter sp.]